jgi:hypothetical protein
VFNGERQVSGLNGAIQQTYLTAREWDLLRAERRIIPPLLFARWVL